MRRCLLTHLVRIGFDGGGAAFVTRYHRFRVVSLLRVSKTSHVFIAARFWNAKVNIVTVLVSEVTDLRSLWLLKIHTKHANQCGL